ncbi:hypothetical protein N7466_002257 [Penicillium verhagenii]|uniref:uncharacterized protein n=1 Tax=Penicillium verhagenii TaxID=1562060 RepID=UPI0025458161|nr:uncharacterized protein N7466_002257 [Penicillium verhagenii]KAJ5939123.1 hypothetical protein N7466_002257 [Penicillium verhagenii]
MDHREKSLREESCALFDCLRDFANSSSAPSLVITALSRELVTSPERFFPTDMDAPESVFDLGVKTKSTSSLRAEDESGSDSNEVS